MDAEIKQAIDALGQGFEAFKAAHAAELAEIKKHGKADPLTEQKLEKISKALDDLQANKDAAEKKFVERVDALEKKLNRPGLGNDPQEEMKALSAFNLQLKMEAVVAGRPIPGDIDVAGMVGYKSALGTYLRKGRDGLSTDEFKALSVAGDPQGGYLVMPDTNGRIVTRLRDYSPMRQLAFVQSIGTDALEGLTDRDEADAGWVGEKAARPATDTPEVGKWRIAAEEMYANPQATQKLLDDSSVDLEAWLSGKVADKLGRVEGDAFTAGNGVVKPRGFTTYTTAATGDDSRSWGQFEHVATGVNGAFAGSNPADHLLDLIGKFNAGYLQNAVWMGRREVKTAIRKFKGSDNNYLWQPGLQAGQPQRLLEYPWYDNQYMPALSSNGLSLALGDFQQGYTIVDRMGTRVLVDPYSNKPYVGFYSTRRVGGAASNFDAIKFIKFATS